MYNLVDDDPSPQAVWLPAFAKFLGAPVPPHMSEAEAMAIAGGRCGVLRDEAEWGLECEGEAGSRVEAATTGVAGGVSKRHRSSCSRIICPTCI